MSAYRTSGRKVATMDGWPTTLSCPRHHGILRYHEIAPDLPVAFCPVCGGVFVSQVVFFRIRNFDESSVASFAGWLDTLNSPDVVDARAPASCPACEAPMLRLAIPEKEEGLALDACSGHGVWLDNGELSAARAHEPVHEEPPPGLIERFLSRR